MLPLKDSVIYYRLLHCKIVFAFVNYRSKIILIYSDNGQFMCYFHALLISVPKQGSRRERTSQTEVKIKSHTLDFCFMLMLVIVCASS